MSYIEAANLQKHLIKEMRELEKKAPVFSKNSMGLISHSDMQSDEYKNFDKTYKEALNKLKIFNKWFLKAYKKDIQKNRRKYKTKSEHEALK